MKTINSVLTHWGNIIEVSDDKIEGFNLGTIQNPEKNYQREEVKYSSKKETRSNFDKARKINPDHISFDEYVAREVLQNEEQQKRMQKAGGTVLHGGREFNANNEGIYEMNLIKY